MVHERGLENSGRDLATRVAEELGTDRMYACFECGHCTSCCPVRRIDARLSPRKLLHMILLNMMEDVLSGDAIWLCSSCYACQEACPQDIKITDLITSLKNMAFQKGHAPQGVMMQADLIRRQGRLYALDEFDLKKREKADLPAVFLEIDEARRLLEDDQ
jgi:heterodisulfide reductase subunit C2